MALAEAARYSTRVEGDLARLYLESEGLDAVLFDAEVSYFFGGLFVPVRLMVLDEELELAQRLLSEASAL